LAATTLKEGEERLRAKLGDDASAPRYIATVRGVGYRWVAPLSPAPAEDKGPGRS